MNASIGSTQRQARLLAAAVAAAALAGNSCWAQSSPTIVTFPWDWHIEVVPVGGINPIPIGLWGTATIAFGAPTDGAGNTYPLGPGGGLGAPAQQPPPVGATWSIPIELVQMNLTSMGPIAFPQGSTEVVVRESPTRRSEGGIVNLVNNGDGTIKLDSFFDIFVEIDLPQAGGGLGMTLFNDEALRAGMSFGTSPPAFPVADPLPQLDVLWAPTWLWREGFAQDLLNLQPPHELWDRWISIHAHVTPEPASAGLMLTALAAVAIRRKR